VAARILIVAEHDGSTLNASTAKCVTCAQSIGGSIDVAVCADDAGSVAAQAAKLARVANVLAIENAANAHPVAALLAPQIVAVVRSGQYTHVLGPSTTFGRDLMPRVAALLDAPQVSDIMAVESPARFRRPIYAGNVLVTVEVDAPVIVGTVRTASYQAAAGDGSAVIEKPATTGVEIPGHSRFVSVSAAKNDRPDLQTARRVVSGGRALGSSAGFELLYRLAEKLGAAVGASRAAVDAGYVPNEMQVGQTGKIIAPELYFAIGISGAIQHLTGIKDARTIVAINKDADAPIFEVADYGLVGDLFEIVPQLIELL